MKITLCFTRAVAAFALLFTFAQQGFAQHSEAPKVTFVEKNKWQRGAMGGANVSHAYGELANHDLVLRGHIGAFAEYKTSSSKGVHLGLQYIGKGVTIQKEYVELRLNYLQVPVLFMLNNSGSHHRFSFMAGGYLAHLVQAKVSDGKERVYVLPDFSRSDFGLSLGAKFYASQAFFGCQYNHGLLNVLRDDQFLGAQTFHNKSLQIYFGVNLR